MQRGDGILAHVLNDHYNPPKFVRRNDYTKSSTLEVDSLIKVRQWLEYFEEQVKAYRTKNVLVMWGDDFSEPNYNTASQIMRLVTDNLSMDGLANQYEMKFSTMTDYFDSVFAD